jgi:RNA methyltransferase, TrmH family
LKISSTHNPGIRHLLSLSKPSRRKKEKLFIIEGFREIIRAEAFNFTFVSVFYCPEMIREEISEWLNRIKGKAEKYEVTRQVFSKISYRENVDGLVVVAETRTFELHDHEPGENPLILVLESLEKPGNLGAILRSADAAGVDAIIICDPKTDIYNPNVVRSSIGCLFSNTVISCESEVALEYLIKNNISIFSAALQDAVLYTDADFTGPTAIILGSEAGGLSKLWREKATKIIRIPMTGIADSLNVSVSAAILIFEAVRQRNELPDCVK